MSLGIPHCPDCPKPTTTSLTAHSITGVPIAEVPFLLYLCPCCWQEHPAFPTLGIPENGDTEVTSEVLLVWEEQLRA